MSRQSLLKPHFLIRSLFLASLALALVWGLARTQAAQAAFSSCRSDPVFVLSDGTILDVSVSIGTNVNNVDEIHYTVHGPKGVKLIAAISTPTLGFDGLETVTYIGDLAPNRFTTDTLVHTDVDNVPASSYTIFAGNGLLQLKLTLTAQYHVIQGWAEQHLVANLSK